MADTANMGLTLPVVSTTLGPTWASELNAALEEVDAHDHTTGKGVRVPSAGLNINANVSWGDFSITSLGSADLTAQGSALASGSRRIFAYNGELYYRDAAGNNVQITSAGTVNTAGSGNISGLTAGGGETPSATFTGATDQFGWFYDTGKQAKMQMADILLFPYSSPTTYTNFITLKAPTTLATNPTYTLPVAAAASDTILGFSSAGVMSAGAPDGTQAAPSITFASDLDTGWWRPGTNILAASTGGTERLRLLDTGAVSTIVWKGPAGSVSAPTYSFSGDTDSGFYNPSVDQINVAIGGVARAIFYGNGLQMPTAYRIETGDGTFAAPSYTFTNDTDTGLYTSASNVLDLVTGGNRSLVLTATDVQFSGVLWQPNGTAGAPSYSFASDPDTGLYRYAPNAVGISTNGALSLYVGPATVQAPSGDASAPGYAFLTEGGSGMYLASAGVVAVSTSGTALVRMNNTGISLDGGGTYFKATRVSLGNTSNATASFTVAHGISSFTAIVGISLVAQIVSSGNWVSYTGVSNGASSVGALYCSSTNIVVTVETGSATSRNFYAIIQYI